MFKLRGHHLVCLHFFNGEGYDDSFVRNIENILVSAGDEDIMSCHEADDVCGSCPHLKAYSCQYSEHADNEVRKMDEMALNLLRVNSDTMVKWQDIKERIPEIFNEWHKCYCEGCSWKQACEKNRFYQELKRR